jgi:lipid A disaccharide synthetase
LPILIEAMEQVAVDLHRRKGPQALLHVLVPLAHEQQLRQAETLLGQHSHHSGVRYHFFLGRSAECMVAGEAGLIKSGTSTLEAGVLGLPHLVVYRPGPVSRFLFQLLVRRSWLPRFLRGYQGPVGLVNLFTGWTPGVPYRVPEFFGADMSARKLASALIPLLWEPQVFEKQKQVLNELSQVVRGSARDHSPLSPSRTAATLLLDQLLSSRRVPGVSV